MLHDYDHLADSSPGDRMQEFARANGVLALDQATGRCQCGCQASTAPKSRFLPGHDAKLKSKLMRAAAADVSVQRFDGATPGPAPAMEVARQYGWEAQVEKGADRIRRRSNTPLAAEKRLLKQVDAGREGWTLERTARWGETRRMAAVWKNDASGRIEVHYVTPEGEIAIAPLTPNGA